MTIGVNDKNIRDYLFGSEISINHIGDMHIYFNTCGISTSANRNNFEMTISFTEQQCLDWEAEQEELHNLKMKYGWLEKVHSQNPELLKAFEEHLVECELPSD